MISNNNRPVFFRLPLQKWPNQLCKKPPEASRNQIKQLQFASKEFSQYKLRSVISGSHNPRKSLPRLQCSTTLPPNLFKSLQSSTFTPYFSEACDQQEHAHSAPNTQPYEATISSTPRKRVATEVTRTRTGTRKPEFSRTVSASVREENCEKGLPPKLERLWSRYHCARARQAEMKTEGRVIITTALK